MQCGLRAVPAGSGGCAVHAGGPSGRDARHYRRAVSAIPGQAIRSTIAGARATQGRRGHPIWFSAGLIAEFLALPEDGAARDVVRAHADETEFLDVDDAGILADIDDPEAYRVLDEGAAHEALLPRSAAFVLATGRGRDRRRPVPECRSVWPSLEVVAAEGAGPPGGYRQSAFQPLKGPAFSVERDETGPGVVIHEDPTIGIEPIAYVETMEVRPSIWSLLVGQIRDRLHQPGGRQHQSEQDRPGIRNGGAGTSLRSSTRP